LVLFSAPGDFSPGTLVFPPPQKPTFPSYNLIQIFSVSLFGGAIIIIIIIMIIINIIVWRFVIIGKYRIDHQERLNTVFFIENPLSSNKKGTKYHIQF